MQPQQIDFSQIESSSGIKFRFPSETTSLGDVISAAIPIILFVAGGLLLLYLISGGFRLMTSGGDPKAVEAGKKTITNALVGFVIVFVAFWVVQLLATILGLDPIIKTFRGF